MEREAHRTNRSMKTTRPQSVNRKQVEQFLASAQNKAIAARKNLDIDAEAAYQIAYEAMLKGSLALIISHGSRPRVQLWHHRAIIEFAQRHLDPKFAPTFALFDRMPGNGMMPFTMWPLSPILKQKKRLRQRINS